MRPQEGVPARVTVEILRRHVEEPVVDEVVDPGMVVVQVLHVEKALYALAGLVLEDDVISAVGVGKRLERVAAVRTDGATCWQLVLGEALLPLDSASLYCV